MRSLASSLFGLGLLGLSGCTAPNPDFVFNDKSDMSRRDYESRDLAFVFPKSDFSQDQKSHNCLAWYHFDNPNPLLNSCRNSQLTDFNSNQSPSLTGLGQARHFDGGSYMIDDFDPDFILEDILTLEAYVKPDKSNTSYDPMFGFGGIIWGGIHAECVKCGFSMIVMDTPGIPNQLKVAFYLNEKYHEVKGSTSLNNKQFYYVKFTYDGSKMRLYVNNRLDGEAIANGSIISKPQQSILIGPRFKGAIDEVRVSNVVR